ncbi:hypothetical protein [Jiella sonneratiae]|uniref:DUF2746 domain-containing protein n=1 Tax=Jiella sonneratiae TaxID=2816856 RepID=A0ABS3J712_9HYPH|nr:hypothetical protein [Jiella sonneratiae]MBO0905458.1 hypothetical protein [Jiella sonneratiae]
MPDAGSLPEWVLWTGGVIGVAVSTVVLKLGLKRGERSEPARIDAALVDGVSVRNLAGSVEALALTMRELDKSIGERARQAGREGVEQAEAFGELIRDLAREVQELRLELRQLRAELGRG